MFLFLYHKIVFISVFALVAVSFAAHIDIQPVDINCDEPICADNQTYYPHWDPWFYYECIPDLDCGWAPIARLCPPGTYFSYKNQSCVSCEEWENPCGIEPPPKTTQVIFVLVI